MTRSKILAGATRCTALMVRAVVPAVRRSFGFRSVAAATITLATTAGSSPPLVFFRQHLVVVAPSRRVERHGGVGLHAVACERGIDRAGLDEQDPDAVLADLVVQ
jgi:hypothetical protein